MGAFVDRIKDWWSAADKTQRLVTVFGVVFLVAIIGLTAMFAGKPKMMPVLTGLTETERSSVYDELLKGGFKVEVTPQSEVVVPSSDVAKARMHLASKNKLPKSGGNSFSIVESIGFTDSQKKEQEKLAAAKEMELAESISTMAGVSAAQVHLTPGKDSPFGDQTSPPAAAVRITESEPGALTQESGKAIARLVQNSITGMTAKGVTVLTDAGRMVYDGAEQDTASSIAITKLQAEADEARKRQIELQSELDMVYGVGNTIVDVDLQLNMDATQIKKDETVRSGDPVSEVTSSETMGSSGSKPLNPSGTQANLPGQAGSVDGGKESSNYQQEQKEKQYPTSNTLTQITKAAGELVAMNVSVQANTAQIKDLKSLQSRVDAYIAPYQGDPRFVASVTGVEFSTAANKAADEAAKRAASAATMQLVVSLLPVAALVAVALVLMKSLSKAMKPASSRTLALSNGQTVTVPGNIDPQILAYLEQPAALPAGGEVTDEEFEEVEEETGELDETGEPVKVKTRRKKKSMYDDDEDDDDISISSIKTKVDVPLEQVRKMSRRNPEAVATLLKSWMMEEAGRP